MTHIATLLALVTGTALVGTIPALGLVMLSPVVAIAPALLGTTILLRARAR